ncbi:SRPBCC family protein [Glycomyces terrestris]|uniref:SRPBCC domain-containing protein n=1 Tax=Glycomyces terrestris TaxID=2493553 RepID=A0A426UXV3_9ACTN|nr:hypothetical protein [Glycomyces terrestris]RRR99399.1 hypothetical protein EIW28_11845 [Glycomyces terrestris]
MTDDSTPTTPRIEVVVAAPADEVWHALRDRDALRQWHGWDSGGDTAALDAEIDSIYFTDVHEDPARRLLTANGGDRFAVEPHADGARVVLTRAPLSGDADWDAYYDEVTEGWITFLHQLRFALERPRGAARRTLFFSAPATPRRAVLARLGLDGQDAPPGAPYAAPAMDLAGDVWFRSPRQLGVTVDAWGPGLLAVAGAPGSDTAMAVLSTFGLPDAEFKALEQRWTDWWHDRD